MITPCFDDSFFFQNPKFNPQQPNPETGILENHDGSHMLVAETVTIDLEEDIMPIEKDSPLTIRWAIGLCVATLLGALAIAGGTYALIHSDVNDVRSDLTSSRDKSGDDVDSLRGEMNQGFTRVADKLDDINKTLLKIQVDQATQRAKEEKSN
ncbi:hypothetical protein [Pantoea sp. UYEF8]|uniref:hypothetical protein n=1 Tax=Pantoea sp. UYEF8 TaxID=1756394 RepID=UPI0033925CC6